MVISAIIPCLNEASHIESIIDVFFSSAPSPSEAIVVDAGSNDGTVELIQSLISKYEGLTLINNPDKTVSTAFNKAFPLSKGRYVCLLGAHSYYSSNYFREAYEVLKRNEADAVGGFLEQYGVTAFGEAAALAMSSKFGVGDTEFRTTRRKCYVDSVAFAIYKREVFASVGLLDTDLIRNQDDELHYRINRFGYKILMLPNIYAQYQVRSSPSKLFTQYYQYGLFKPLVLKKIKTAIRFRHIVPAMFVFYLFSLPLIAINPIWIAPLLAYIKLSLINALLITKSRKISEIIRIIYASIILHFAYGIGFVFGLKKIV